MGGGTLHESTVTAVAKNRPWLLALAIVVLTSLAYQPVWRAGFIWDDDYYVANNTTLRTLDGLRRIWFELGATPQYYPLTHTGFWVEYHLWGLNPTGYHLVNVWLHAVNSILVLLVLRELGVKGAWLAAGIFALHPVHVESVAWVTERKNVLSGFFYLGALLAYVRFLAGCAVGAGFSAGTHSQIPGANPKRWRFYGLALTLYLCALFSKSVTSSLPLVILLLVWWKRGRVDRRDAYLLLPFLALGIAIGLTTVWAEKHVVGAEGEEWLFSWSERCLIAGRALWFYIGKLMWPWNLTFIYPRWDISSRIWWQYLYPLGVVGAVLGLWARRDRWGRGALVAVLVFVVTLVPALGFFDIFPFRYSFVADHFQYLASLSMIACAAGGIAHILDRGRLWSAPVGNAICSVLLVTLAGLTWRQAHIYRNIETLWEDTLAKNPNAWMAHYNLGQALSEAGRFEEAIGHYKQGLQVYPDDPEARNNLGVALMQVGQIEEAIGQYEQALRIKPEFADAHSNLGLALVQTGRAQEAVGHLEQALRLKPDFAEAHNNLGLALARLGKLRQAIEHWEQALRIKPDFVKAYHNLGNALLQEGKLEAAIGNWEQVLRFKPDHAEAHYNLGSALARLGRAEEAIEHWEQALRIKPDLAEAHYNLGVALVEQGQVPEAIGHWQQALRIKPEYAEAHYNLGLALEQTGKIQEAIGHYEQTLKIQPDYAEAQNRLMRLRAIP